MSEAPKSAVALQGKEVMCKLIVKEAEEGSEYGPQLTKCSHLLS